MFNSTIKEFKNAFVNYSQPNATDAESKGNIVFTMLAFEDFFIRLAEERLNDTNPKITYESDQLRE